MPQLVLFMKETCPFCQKVVNFVNDHDLKIEKIDIIKNEEFKNMLIQTGGKAQVPCLFIDNQALYESNDIIEYLKSEFKI